MGTGKGKGGEIQEGGNRGEEWDTRVRGQKEERGEREKK